jgi:hypothetical protein
VPSGAWPGSGNEQAVAAVGRVGELSRHACRGVFEERFDAARMVRDYLDVYRRLVYGGSERMQSAPRAPQPLALATRNGSGRRGPFRSPAPLLGVLPCVE